MAKLDPRRIATFLADPRGVRVVLLYGDDAGLVRERAEMLIRNVTGGDPFRLVELPREVAMKDPDRVAAEAATLSFTGGPRLVRLREASDAHTAAAQAALRGQGPGLVLFEAGVLDGRKGLRALVEKAGPDAVAIPCYVETGRAAEAAVRALLDEYGLSADPPILAWIAQNLGEDRSLLRRECEKLALFLGPGHRVQEEDVLAVLAEGALSSVEAAFLAAIQGEVAFADRAIETALAAGATPVQLVRGALKQVQRLTEAAMVMAQGRTMSQAIETLRPPLFFKLRPAFETALRLWTVARLQAAAQKLFEAERQTKTSAMPAAAIARAAVLRIAIEAEQSKTRRL